MTTFACVHVETRKPPRQGGFGKKRASAILGRRHIPAVPKSRAMAACRRHAAHASGRIAAAQAFCRAAQWRRP